ncbi:DUF6287 domain-containing protein [Streptococcus equinus]|uniref:DUF6287 domain-containing protein n=1 Tax=Streptococcus equinus TaxID=1335 RepID=UPI001143BC89|nr:DUF6287 domain-containing protein [Streptococcus equinus]
MGACSKNEKATSASSSHAKVIRTSNSVAEKKTVKSSISSNRESTVSTSSVTEIETAEVEVTEKAETVPSQQQQSCTNDDSLNFEQIAYGDFSSLSGTWTNDLGESITLTQGGQVSLSQSQALYQITTNIVKDDVYFGTIYNPNSMTDSAAFIVVPKGVADPFLGEVGATDRLIVGQCGSASEHPFLKN